MTTPPTIQSPTWQRWSTWALVAAVALVATGHALRLAMSQVVDCDIWWIATAGREMLRSGHVPQTNAFSFAEPDHPWVMHEWLLGPIFATGLTALGPRFFIILALASGLLMILLLLMGTLGRSRHPAAGAILALVGLMCFDDRLGDVRPMSLALALPLSMTLLTFGAPWSRGRAAAAVLLQWVWTNLHGSFPIGLVLLGAGALAAPRERRARVVTTGLAALSTLVNPYGLKLHLLVIDYLLGRGEIFQFIHAEISEFGPLWRAHEFVTRPVVAGLVLLALLALAGLRFPAQRVASLLSLVLLVMAVRQARHLQLAGLTSLVLLAPAVDLWLDRWAPGGVPWRKGILALMAPAVLLGTAMHLRRPAAPPGAWLCDYLGHGALYTLVPRAGPGSHLVTPFGVAGLVMWLSAPEGGQILFDPRNDCYQVQTARDGFELEDPGTPARTDSLLAHYRATGVVAADDSPLAQKVRALPNWRTIASSEQWSLFAPAEALQPAAQPP